MAFAVLYEWREHIYLPSGIFRKDHIDNLVFIVLDHRLSGHVAPRLSHSGKKKPEKVVYLRGGADRTAWILVDSFLLYRNHGTQSCDLIHVGTFERTEHIAGI